MVLVDLEEYVLKNFQDQHLLLVIEDPANGKDKCQKRFAVLKDPIHIIDEIDYRADAFPRFRYFPDRRMLCLQRVSGFASETWELYSVCKSSARTILQELLQQGLLEPHYVEEIYS